MSDVTEEIMDRAVRMLTALDGMPIFDVIDTITFAQSMIISRQLPLAAQPAAIQRCRASLDLIELAISKTDKVTH